MVSNQELHLKISRRIGFAHYVLSARTNSAKRKNQKVCQNMEVISS